MKVTTKKAKRGKTICSDCGGELILRESEAKCMPKSEIPYMYMMEYSVCETCEHDFVLSRSIIKNDERRKQARLEATVIYKMQKWLNQDHP